jgi:1-deoxy-D-xylulose-5-phosphate reductoisomerase
MKAQMGLPDMKLPIQYALAYPQRIPSNFPRFDFMNYPSLSFEAPDRLTFPCLDLAYEAMRLGGNAACRLNAANEVAVAAFLKEEISYHQIPEMLEYCLLKGSHKNQPAYEDYVSSDAETREMAQSWKEERKLIKKF